jgi:hypothetical protein
MEQSPLDYVSFNSSRYRKHHLLILLIVVQLLVGCASIDIERKGPSMGDEKQHYFRSYIAPQELPTSDKPYDIAVFLKVRPDMDIENVVTEIGLPTRVEQLMSGGQVEFFVTHYDLLPTGNLSLFYSWDGSKDECKLWFMTGSYYLEDSTRVNISVSREQRPKDLED